MPLILILDSDFDFAAELASELAEEGWRAMRANCVPHALALLALSTPDAAVLDGGLADGPDAERLALRLREREIPRLVVEDPEAQGETAWADEAAASLQKPFGGGEVLSALLGSPAQAA